MFLRASAAAPVSGYYLRQVEMPRRQTDGDVGGEGFPPAIACTQVGC